MATTRSSCRATARSIVTAAQCAAPRQSFAGVGATCAPTRGCIADLNGDGAINAADLLAFITLFFAGC